ncbi:VOC family protein [Jiella pacifica]|uniref:VOC family protein n=1 Tax=Jiella pacifica TaxID=2696469 RepID=UPI0035E43B8B
MATETKDAIATCLWFDENGEEAARFYVDLFPGSSIDRIMHAPGDYPSGSAGNVLMIDFTLFGRRFQALNGGPNFTFSEAISLSIDCDGQDEVDRYHDALSAHPENEACGWVKDRFGLSWQDRPAHPADAPLRSGPGEGQAGDGGDDDDEEDRRRSDRAGREGPNRAGMTATDENADASTSQKRARHRSFVIPGLTRGPFVCPGTSQSHQKIQRLRIDLSLRRR